MKVLYDLWTGHPSLHKPMYDPPTLSSQLGDAGFREIVEVERNHSRGIPDIAALESGTGYECSLYMEAFRV